MKHKEIVAMSTQSLERPAQTKTCANCPYFQSFGEASGRGWCGVFDCMAREHHEFTTTCKQEIEALEKQAQQPALEPEAECQQQQPVGFAGDSVSVDLQPIGDAIAEFETGRCHGQQDAASRRHRMYTQPLSEYAAGYLEGYDSILNPSPQTELVKAVEWSVRYNANWGWYDVWVASSCCLEKGSSYEEAERIAQHYIAASHRHQEHRRAVLAAYAG